MGKEDTISITFCCELLRCCFAALVYSSCQSVRSRTKEEKYTGCIILDTGYYQYQDTEFVFDMLVHPFCSAWLCKKAEHSKVNILDTYCIEWGNVSVVLMLRFIQLVVCRVSFSILFLLYAYSDECLVTNN